MDTSIDIIGPWSEIKLSILGEYAKAYSTIMSAKRQRSFNLSHGYIDGFAGYGLHISRESGKVILGSPLEALTVSPSFDEYHFVELRRRKLALLNTIAEHRTNVYVYNGDCNHILIKEVFPRFLYHYYKRALCVLDPYGLHLSWEVVLRAGAMGTIDLFLNFPLMDIHRTAGWRRPDLAPPQLANRMTRFWGDESWMDVLYNEPDQLPLFGNSQPVKAHSQAIVTAFGERLKKVARFRYVPDPLPMKNGKGNILYYLFFASNNEAASRIASSIFRKYKTRGSV